MIRIRELKQEEVEFGLQVELECDIPVEGNAMCSDDEEADKKYEQELLDRLERGDTTAWCMLIVTAKWKGYEGRDVLGGVTLREANTTDEDIENAWEMANWHGMKKNALDSLNGQLAAWADTLSELEVR